ncbi:MAG: iron ABC transporter permease [Clostridia bacterium]|nr:iron ABC transporter permease [Clostridia bacterium]
MPAEPYGMGVPHSHLAPEAKWRTDLRNLTCDPALLFAVLAVWAAMMLFVLYPLSKLIGAAFLNKGQVTVKPLIQILSRPNNRLALRNSIFLGTLVAVIGTALGYLFAFTYARIGVAKSWQWIIDAACLLPMISPPFTSALAILFALGPRGLITYNILGIGHSNIYGLQGALLAEVLTYFPIAYLTMRGVLANVDLSMEDAAFSLGGSRLRVFLTVSLPLTIPGLANSLLVLFASSLADFASPLILSGARFPVLPTQAYLQITGLYDMKGGAALCFLLLVPSLVIFSLQRYWVGRRSYITVSGKSGAQSGSRIVSAGARWVLLGICLCISIFIFFLYGSILFGSLVRAWGANHTFTLENYRYIFTFGRKAIRDTLMIAFASMPLGGLYGVLVGYLVSKKSLPGKGLMEFVSMINYSLPGIIVGIGYLLSFNNPPFAIAGTAWILIAAYVFRYSATGIRATIATLHQIDPAIEEASASLGASTATTFRKITIPLVAPAFFAGLEIMFIRAMTAISATIFLISVNWTLITVRILEGATELELGHAAGFSILVIAIVFITMSVIRWVMRRAGMHESVGVTQIR